MAILNKLISKLTSKRLEQIDYFRKNPFEVQQQTFINLINEANNTIWGKKFAYNEIKNFNDYELFTNRVPISSYNELKPFIDRVRSGEQNVLWSSEIKWFAKSSGTTADKSKFIPVSNEALEFCHFRGGRDVLVLYSEMFPETNIFKGRALGVGGSQQISNMDNDMYYGDLSAVLIENLPFWADFLRTPSKNIALHPEWEEKIEQMAKITSKQNVTNISGVPSWTLVLLKKILEITGKNNISEVWENLELFVHGGVSFVPYFEEYKRFISSQSMRYMETYNASEGFFSIQDDLSSDDMLLMLDYGIFYEFIRLEDVEQSSPKIYTLMEVELKTNYAIIISTNGGLWRYLIGDTIIFTSKKPFKIKITGRTKHFINAFGEEVIIDNAETALKIACEKQILQFPNILLLLYI